jgi:hypothetical protein
MAGADQPEDLRCACTTKFAEVTKTAILYGCRGCDEPLILPFDVLAGGKTALIAYLTGLPPRKKRFGRRRRKRPRT